MAPQTPLQAARGSESIRTTGASPNVPPGETQQWHQHQVFHPNAANIADSHMTQDTHLKIVGKTGRPKNRKQHAIGCEWMKIGVDGHQLTIYCAAGVRRELPEQFIPARNGEPSWLTKAFVSTVRQIEHHDVDSSGIFTGKSCNKCPQEWK